MKENIIDTILGKIAVGVEEGRNDKPIVFMHGVFLDKSLWADFDTKETGRMHIYIDMPAHGESSNVGREWNLDECVTMLIEIIDYLKFNKCIVVGHSWGSMTALRSAIKHPERFESLCLCNMPFQKTTGLSKIGFTFQKMLTKFQRFYAKQAAKALYSSPFLQAHPECSKQMQQRLARRPGKEISRVIDAVILDPEDSSQMIKDLQVSAIAVVGELDYVGTPPKIETITVRGGHISPHEATGEVKNAINQLI